MGAKVIESKQPEQEAAGKSRQNITYHRFASGLEPVTMFLLH
jgi:hypothetical protein